MKYVIIGASAAGLSAAKTIRNLDINCEIKIISEDEEVYSRCMLPLFINGERSKEELNFVEDDFFEKNKISWVKGKKVISVLSDLKLVKTADGEEYEYDKLLIATGAAPFLPPIEGLDRGKQIFTLRNLEDAKKIREMASQFKNIVVIGGGLVGVEVAVSLVKNKNQVTIIEMGKNILPLQLDMKAASKYEELFRKNGIEIIINNSVSSILLDENLNVKKVILKSGKEIEADMVIVAAGVKPNTSLVQNTSIKVEKGIVVDQYQKTSVADIFAAGDVCQSFETFKQENILTPIWPIAVKQGEVAAYNMVGIKRSLANNFAFKNSMRFFGLSTISYGFTEPPDNSYQVETLECCESYYKIIHKMGIIYGAIFQGDISEAGVYGKLIQEKIDISEYLNHIFELTYGDFFKEDKNGAFSYNLDKAL